ncbi:pyridoxamine 5'-phosphate oxidase family protein [Sedimentibacter sp. B4]|uniref:pyridoxamine 5'-phosphate oxidase family protein n=1 Tax=Sedimentibacter sp. B4 TaxID=304766 RepID=UPI0002DD44E2|nr:pyridoxamine 5'-phosphate oxidase family protein [Sedimentibacter sp. B4]
MNEAIKFIKENPVMYFSTVGLDSNPKVRPFQFMFEKEGKLYFCTSNQKDVYAEIKNHPVVELTTCNSNFAWIRLSGKAAFVSDAGIKKDVLESSELVKSIYKTPDNPTFEVFYLESAKATIADFSGNPPKEYSL